MLSFGVISGDQAAILNEHKMFNFVKKSTPKSDHVIFGNVILKVVSSHKYL